MTLPTVSATNPSAPIACSLTGPAAADRERDWHALLSRASVSRSFAPGRVRIELSRMPGVRAELERLIAAEHDCCPFMTITVDTSDEATLVLAATAPEPAAPILYQLFGGVGPHRPEAKAPRPTLRRFAAALIAVSVATGLLTVFARAVGGILDVRVLEGVTLFLAAGAYLAYALAHHRNRRELVTRSILVSAFALWGIVQIAPGFAGSALLNDITILLFVTDLAFLLSPWN